MLNEGDDVYGVLGSNAEQTMLDDLAVIYAAATSTTQISVNNLIKYIHMDKYTYVKDKLLAEVDEFMAFEPWDGEGNHINHDLLQDACSYENIQEGLDYTMMCFRESMRIESPLPMTTSNMVTKDVVL